MNLYLRMLLLLFTSLAKEKITVHRLSNNLSLRVMPNDLDLNLHMNNGRYLTICDLSRMDLFIRSGLGALMWRNRWRPIIAQHDMKYFKPLSLFQKYEVEMTVAHWDEKYFHSTHSFKSKGVEIAKGSSIAVIRGKGGVIPPKTVMQEVEEYQKNRSRKS